MSTTRFRRCIVAQTVLVALLISSPNVTAREDIAHLNEQRAGVGPSEGHAGEAGSPQFSQQTFRVNAAVLVHGELRLHRSLLRRLARPRPQLRQQRQQQQRRAAQGSQNTEQHDLGHGAPRGGQAPLHGGGEQGPASGAAASGVLTATLLCGRDGVAQVAQATKPLAIKVPVSVTDGSASGAGPLGLPCTPADPRVLRLPYSLLLDVDKLEASDHRQNDGLGSGLDAEQGLSMQLAGRDAVGEEQGGSRTQTPGCIAGAGSVTRMVSESHEGRVREDAMPYRVRLSLQLWATREELVGEEGEGQAGQQQQQQRRQVRQQRHAEQLVLLAFGASGDTAGGYAVQLDLDADMGVGAEEPDGRGNVRAVGTAAPLPPLPAGWESAVSHRQPDVTSTPQRAAASVIGTDPVRTASRAQGVPWQPLQRPGASTGAVGSGDSASGAAAAVAPGLQRRDALHGEQQRTKDTGAPGVQSRGSMEAQQSQTTEPHAHQAEGLLVDLAGHCSAAVCHHWAQQQRQQQQHHLPSTCAAHDAAAFLQLAAPASSASRVGEHAVAGTSIQRSCTHASNGGFNNVACVRDTDTCPAIHVSWQPQRREPSGVFPGSGLSLGAGVAEPQVLGAPQPVSTANGKGNWNSNGRPWMAGLLMGITLGFALGGGAVGALVIRSWVRGPGSHGYTASAVNRLGGVAAEPAAAYPGMDQYDGDMYGSMGETAEELAGAAGRPGAGPSRSSQSRGGVGALVQRTLSGVERVLQTPRRQRGAAEGGSPGSGGGGRRLGSIEEEEQGGGQGLMEGSGEAGGAVGAQGGGVAAALASLSPSVLKLLAAGRGTGGAWGRDENGRLKRFSARTARILNSIMASAGQGGVAGPGVGPGAGPEDEGEGQEGGGEGAGGAAGQFDDG